MKKIHLIWITLFLNFSSSYAEYTIDGGIRGETVMQGYIVATPCSIETESQYQYINYDLEFNKKTNSFEKNKINRKPFSIKLNNCISEYDTEKHKGIKINFLAPQDIYSNAIKLSGPTTGVILYIYDVNNNLLIPNRSYSISDSAIYFDSKTKTSHLRYETEIDVINNDIEPGDYFTTIKFNVSYD